MKYTRQLYPHLFFNNAGDGGGGSAAVDRGDDLTPPGDDAAKAAEEAALAAKAAEDEAKKLAGEGDNLDDEETPEEKAEREAAEEEARVAAEKKEREKNIRIPKSRFDEVQAKAREREKALLDKIETLEKNTSARQQTIEVEKFQEGLDKMSDEYEDLIMEGKKEEARAVRRKLDKARDELIEYKAATASARVRTETIDSLKYEAAINAIEAEHPELNPDLPDTYNNEAASEIAVLMQGLITQGMDRAAALKKAVSYVIRPAAGEATKPPVTDADRLAAKKLADARTKALAAAGKTPANTNKVGLNSLGKDDKAIDVMRLTQKGFAELTDAQKAELRGDVL